VLITVLLVFALICFLLAAAGVASRVNLIALGLAAWIATLLIGRG
jgi:hypothetical protein